MGKSTILCLCLLLVQMCIAQTPQQKAQALVKQMTLAEKIAIVHGNGGPYVGNVAANTRLKIPTINLEDGPQGVADGVHGVTCWPASLTVAASWSEDEMFTWSQALGKEQRIKGTNIHLGPDINIARVPTGGRVFEMFGEDPYLTSALAGPSVRGIQSQGVIATAKHFINNDQEYQRDSISVTVDQRTNWEVYYPPFDAAVRAGVGAIMCSYNKINTSWACENSQTLNNDLKKMMKFDGFVMSDWGATHSTVPSANNGLDQEMPGSNFFGAALERAVNSSSVSQSQLDNMVVRILTALYAGGIMENPQTGNLNAVATSPEHNALARQVAIDGTILLKNTGNILPLSKNLKTIAVIGDAGDKSTPIAGGGSGSVVAPYIVTPFTGINAKANVNGAKVTYTPSSPVSNAVNAAKAADIAIVVVGAQAGEGSDRRSLSLPNDQDTLVSSVAAAQPNTVVVVYSPGAVLMPWANSVKAIVAGFFPGQEAGNALASILYGESNPSAKLPLTFPVKENDWFNGNANTYPGSNGVVQYTEKLLVGYRWYDAQNIEPLFPFGHGLSYTTFAYSNARATMGSGGMVNVMIDLKNTGSMTGSEVAQLYLAYPTSAGEPPKVLRGFQKTKLTANEQETVTFKLNPVDYSTWDVNAKAYVPAKGTFTAHIGSSSRDIRVRTTFEIK